MVYCFNDAVLMFAETIDTKLDFRHQLLCNTNQIFRKKMATRLASQRNFVTITPTTNQNQSQSLSEMTTTSSNNGEIITITSTGNSSISESIHHNDSNIPLQQVN